MSSELKVKLERPDRPPDHISKRGIPYWFAPDWVRDLNTSISRIKPIRENGDVNLYMLSKSGNLTYIQGSIQQEFKDWHTNRSIDYMLLGGEEFVDELLETTHDK